MLGRAHGFDQCGRQLAMLDDPGERPFSQLVRGEGDRAVAIAAHVHHLDGREAFRRQPLPGADRAQEIRAAGADRVDA